jgi:hypothetical protein
MLTETEQRRLETLNRLVKAARLENRLEVRVAEGEVWQRNYIHRRLKGPYLRFALVTECGDGTSVTCFDTLAELREVALAMLQIEGDMPELALDLDTGQTYSMRLTLVLEERDAD